MAWATLAQFKANQVNLAGDNSTAGNAQITLSLNATGNAITTCLSNGGYSISAIKAAIVAGAVYDFLILLNIRLAALDLMAGGGASSFLGAQEKTYLRWQESATKTLESLCEGMVYLEDSDGSADVESPQSELSGFVSDSRELGTDIVDPLLEKDGDPLDTDYTSVDV